MKERPILTEDDLRREVQAARCREALRVVGVPESVFHKLDSGPLLFQFAHMTVFLEYPWQDSLRWVFEHKGEIHNYAKSLNEQNGTAATKPD